MADRTHRDAANGWWRVRVATTTLEAELVADALWQHGAAGVEEQGAGDATVLLGGFDARPAADAAAAAATACGARSATVEPIADHGLDGWRQWAEPVRAGSFWLVPPWCTPPAPAERILWLDPGRAFGSGSHPTTRLVLAQLEAVVRPGATMLDVGCGSGVLAIAAALLGASEVTAIDVDHEAIAATHDNAGRNGVAQVVTASPEPLDALVAAERRFDVVAANLLAPTIRELGAALRSAVADGGHLVASGLLAHQVDDALDHLPGLVVVDRADDDGWASVLLVAPHHR